jgi:hypothetical protein
LTGPVSGYRRLDPDSGCRGDPGFDTLALNAELDLALTIYAAEYRARVG